MSLFQELYDAHLTIGGHELLWREIVGNVFGLASALLGMRRRVSAWPVGIIGNVLLFTVFIGGALGGPFDEAGKADLWGQAGRQVFFVIVSVYGWHRWHENRKRGGQATAPAVSPRWANARERTGYFCAAAAAVVACFLIFHAIGEVWAPPTWYFWADSWIFVGSILATYAMARGWVDFWLC